MYNIITKNMPGREYLITDMMATSLNRKQFEAAQKLNPDILGGWRFVPYKDTDFTWWCKIARLLTKTKITRAYFDIDFNGTVKKY